MPSARPPYLRYQGVSSAGPSLGRANKPIILSCKEQKEIEEKLKSRALEQEINIYHYEVLGEVDEDEIAW